MTELDDIYQIYFDPEELHYLRHCAENILRLYGFLGHDNQPTFTELMRFLCDTVTELRHDDSNFSSAVLYRAVVNRDEFMEYGYAISYDVTP